MENAAVDCERLKAETVAELEELYNNPAINAALHRTLPNTAEETDYELWEECFRDTLKRHDAVVREWAADGQ
jgi:hypothetical protein